MYRCVPSWYCTVPRAVCIMLELVCTVQYLVQCDSKRQILHGAPHCYWYWRYQFQKSTGVPVAVAAFNQQGRLNQSIVSFVGTISLSNPYYLSLTSCIATDCPSLCVCSCARSPCLSISSLVHLKFSTTRYSVLCFADHPLNHERRQTCQTPFFRRLCRSSMVVVGPSHVLWWEETS
jgi:hypothetical protein